MDAHAGGGWLGWVYESFFFFRASFPCTVKLFYNESGLNENLFITIGFRETDIFW